VGDKGKKDKGKKEVKNPKKDTQKVGKKDKPSNK
jgi:carbon storage regulator